MPQKSISLAKKPKKATLRVLPDHILEPLYYFVMVQVNTSLQFGFISESFWVSNMG